MRKVFVSGAALAAAIPGAFVYAPQASALPADCSPTEIRQVLSHHRKGTKVTNAYFFEKWPVKRTQRVKVSWSSTTHAKETTTYGGNASVGVGVKRYNLGVQAAGNYNKKKSMEAKRHDSSSIDAKFTIPAKKTMMLFSGERMAKATVTTYTCHVYEGAWQWRKYSVSKVSGPLYEIQNRLVDCKEHASWCRAGRRL
jgi:hypothetical protein